MVSSRFDWSNVLLMDSLTRQPRRRSTRLLSKLQKKPTTPYKSKPYQRIFGGLKKGRKVTSKVNKSYNRNMNEWKQEYNTWDMITDTLNQQLVSNQQIHRGSNDIGIHNGQTNNVQLIHDRQQFNQLFVIDSDGMRKRAENLMGSYDSNSSVSMKLKFRLIPVIEGITVTNNQIESLYKFDAVINEKNNNEIDLEAVEAMEVTGTGIHSETDSTLICDMESSVESIEFTEMFAKINNTVNLSATPEAYSDFLTEIQSKAASFLRSGNVNVPMCSTPKKRQPLVSKTLFPNPLPSKITKPSCTNANPPNISSSLLGIYKGLKDLTRNIRNVLNRIESACSNLIGPNLENFHCDFSMTGVNYLSDSIKV